MKNNMPFVGECPTKGKMGGKRPEDASAKRTCALLGTASEQDMGGQKGASRRVGAGGRGGLGDGSVGNAE